MRRMTLLAAATLLPLAAGPVLAHHGWSSYDANTVLTFEAPILAVRYQNPHGEIELEADGKRWLVVLAPPARMERRGLPRESIEVGEEVTVEGYPHQSVVDELRAERITIDGQTVELR